MKRRRPRASASVPALPQVLVDPWLITEHARFMAEGYQLKANALVRRRVGGGCTVNFTWRRRSPCGVRLDEMRYSIRYNARAAK